MYLLAFDHREAFRSLFGDADDKIAVAKDLAYQAVRATAGEGLGLLVDERLGAATARRARAEGGVTLAMPVERSGQAIFTFDYEDWREHIEDFDPDICKVLVRYHPDGDAGDNAEQRLRLKQLGEYLAPTRRRFLLELIVPGAGVDERPELARRAIEQFQADGVAVDIWKLEGTPSVDAAAMLVAQARTDGRDDVVCTVLGAGAQADTVKSWLTAAAAVDGWTGFAIGRSIWGDPLRAWHAAEIEADEAVRRMSARYAEFIATFEGARALA